MVDTCCIDKFSSTELSEAVSSMWGYYARAQVCFVYLGDVQTRDRGQGATRCRRFVRQSTWFTRGWTLQELLAPGHVHFFDRDWWYLGSREELASEIESATGISKFRGIKLASVATRMSWASGRVTKWPEDIAYCLMGLFDVSMPLLYGEGRERAFLRLQLEIIQATDDESIFAWERDGSPSGMLASSPADFANSHDVVRHGDYGNRRPFEMTNKGLKFHSIYKSRKIKGTGMVEYQVPLNCCRKDDEGSLSLHLVGFIRDDRVFRCGPLTSDSFGDELHREARRKHYGFWAELRTVKPRDWYRNFLIPQKIDWIHRWRDSPSSGSRGGELAEELERNVRSREHRIGTLRNELYFTILAMRIGLVPFK